jgi:hypothetical protein
MTKSMKGMLGFKSKTTMPLTIEEEKAEILRQKKAARAKAQTAKDKEERRRQRRIDHAK